MSKWSIGIAWDDVPHLDEKGKAELLASIPAFERDARTQGVPMLGMGAIYPFPESQYITRPVPIPEHWPRAFGMDVGWNWTAAVWGALERETDTIWVYTEHLMGQERPAVHAAAIRARGAWVPGLIDPAAGARSQVDGRQLLQLYRDEGLDLRPAQNAVHAGIHEVSNRMQTNRLKIFDGCQNTRRQLRTYRWGEKADGSGTGRPEKDDDHLPDALRYLVMSITTVARTRPVPATARTVPRLPVPAIGY